MVSSSRTWSLAFGGEETPGLKGALLRACAAAVTLLSLDVADCAGISVRRGKNASDTYLASASLFLLYDLLLGLSILLVRLLIRACKVGGEFILFVCVK